MKINPKFLKKHTSPVTFERQIVNQNLAQLLTDFMKKHRAIGLAANQVGYDKRVFVMCTDNQVRHCFNPSLVSQSQDIQTQSEGCLSYPKDWINVARSTEIHVKYYNYQGQVIEEKLTGLSARCFLHELDHLNGVTMHDRYKEQNNV